MSVGQAAPARVREPRGVGALYAGNARSVVGRGLLATKSTNWVVVLTGFVEPIFYLLSLGVGLGAYIGTVQDAAGNAIPYAAYIAPALLAVSAMNGAIYDSTWNVFFKMNFGKLYQGMLATSLGPLDVALGEISLALLRGGAYGLGFLLVMQAAGLNLLQRFLENGFDTFKAMRGASEFLGTIERRELAMIDALFSGDAVTQVTTWGPNSRQGDSALVQLP